jgi:hypothetical protein
MSQQQRRSPGLAVQSRVTALKLVPLRTVYPELYEPRLFIRLLLSVVLLVGLYHLSASWRTIVLAQAAVTALWLPFDWQPYYLPTLAVLTPGFATGLQAAQRIMSRLFGSAPATHGRPVR